MVNHVELITKEVLDNRLEFKEYEDMYKELSNNLYVYVSDNFVVDTFDKAEFNFCLNKFDLYKRKYDLDKFEYIYENIKSYPFNEMIGDKRQMLMSYSWLTNKIVECCRNNDEQRLEVYDFYKKAFGQMLSK